MNNNTGILGESIFRSRVGEGGNISRRAYNLVLGGCLLWGFVVNFIIVTFFGESIARAVISNRFGMLILTIGYLVCAIAGIVISTKSDKPSVSFLGYNMVVVPLGAMLSLALVSVSPTVISTAVAITGIVTAMMILLSVAYPDFFLSIGRGLFVALLFAVIIEFLIILIFHRSFAVLDFGVALIFCGYIGFDWARAQRLPSTVDNAIDCSCALYLDIINLFLRILRLIGRNN